MFLNRGYTQIQKMLTDTLINCNLKKLTVISVILLWAPGLQAQSDDIRIGGYLQGMPVRISADLPEPLGSEAYWEYRLQNRLNLKWYISSELSFSWEMRTRLFAGDLVQDIPFYADAIDVDPGYADLSLLVEENDTWLLHYIPDRLNLDWYTDEWRVTAGRQRINWGINSVSNPNDLFNIYSFYDFNYPERPGSDAIRIQHFLDWASRVEVAYSPAREARNSVAAGMYTFNKGGYDIQMITGYYKNNWALGGGWAGSISQTGFKGEVMAFVDLENVAGEPSSNIVAALSADHMFSSSLFLIAEILYNKNGGLDQFVLLGEQLSAENPSYSRYQFTTQASYPFSPIFNGSFAAIYYPDESAAFLSPSVTWSVLQNLDLNLLGQLFVGSENSAFSTAGNVFAGSLTWYY